MPAQPDTVAQRLLRVQRIVRLLRVQPLPAEALLLRINRELQAEHQPEVGLRTLQHDLEWMLEHLGRATIEKVARSSLKPEAPPELHHHRWFYRIAGSEDLIPVTTELCFVTELEALALQTARAQLTAPSVPDAPKGSHDEGPLAQALGQLIHRLGLGREGMPIPDLIGVNLSVPQPYNPHLVLAILRAIRQGSAVAMHYAPLNKPAHAVLVQPVRLVLNDGEPYLWAFDAAVCELKNYKVSRIASVELRDGLPEVPAGLDAVVKGNLINAFRGVAGKSQRARVVVRFTAEAVPHIRERRFGGGQRWEDLPDGGARLSFNTHGLEAVRHWVLQCGSQAVVEEPPQLVAWIRAEAERMVAGYVTRSGATASAVAPAP
jgi:hypothetical protein